MNFEHNCHLLSLKNWGGTLIITIGSKVKDGEGNTYTLTEELGHGGFGCVYKAECEADKSVYAVKTLLYLFGYNGLIN